MIFYIALSILFTSSLFVILKSFAKWNINNIQGLVFNYFTASLFAFGIGFKKNVEHVGELASFYPISLMIGLLFIIVFYLTTLTAQQNGISVATIASKMSVVIPALSGIWLYTEPFTLLKFAGLSLALTSVYLTGKTNQQANKSKHTLLLPVLVFLGCGIIDTMLKYFQSTAFTDTNSQLYASSYYGCAGIFGLLVLGYQLITQKQKLHPKSILAGIFLGLCNYPSLHFLFLALKYPGADSGKIFTIINVGIVICTVLSSKFIFKEKINIQKFTGITIALLAIVILYFA